MCVLGKCYYNGVWVCFCVWLKFRIETGGRIGEQRKMARAREKNNIIIRSVFVLCLSRHYLALKFIDPHCLSFGFLFRLRFVKLLFFSSFIFWLLYATKQVGLAVLPCFVWPFCCCFCVLLLKKNTLNHLIFSLFLLKRICLPFDLDQFIVNFLAKKVLFQFYYLKAPFFHV